MPTTLPASEQDLKDIASLSFITEANKKAFGVSEPAALSSSSGADNFKNNINPAITSANEAINQSKQTREQQKKNATTAAKDSDVPPDVQAEMDSFKDPVELAQTQLFESWTRQQEEAVRTAEALTAAATRSAKASINLLTGTYRERRQLLEESNRQSQASWKQQFLRFGQAEYSPGMTADFMGQKEKEGMKIITDLDNSYQAQVASINSALEEKKYSTAASLTTQLRGLEEKMNEQILKNAEEAKANNDKLRENILKTSRENTIGNLITQYGITNPVELQDYLNNDETGNQIGDVSLDEIDKVLKIMGLDEKNQMAGLTADYKTYMAMKKTGELNEDWTYTDYLAATSAAKRAPKTAGSGGSSAINSTVADESGTLLSFEEFKFSPEAKEMLNEEMARQMKEKGTASLTTSTGEAFLKKIYDESVMAYYRDNPDFAKKYTASNIPPPLRDNLVTDITNEFTLSELISAYPDISSSYITSTYNALKKKKETEKESTISDEDFLKALKGE